MPRHSIIIGAGISGLAAGWYLQKKNWSVTILEKKERPGGWIKSFFSEGFLFEGGPRSLRPHPTTAQLIQALNLQEEIVEADSSSKKRFLYVDQKLKKIPFSFLGSLLRAAWKDLRSAPSTLDESVYSFFSRRFGEKIADTFASALVAGIFAGNPKKLSLRSCFPKLHEWEQKEGSVIKGFLKQKKSASLYSFRNGMQTLVDALASSLNIRYSCHVSSLTPTKDSVQVILSNGDSLLAHRVILALPPAALAELFPSLKLELDQIPAVSVASVNLGYREKLLKREGFGYLIPEKEGEDILGVVFDSCTFPSQNKHPDETRLTVMLGGSRHPEIETYSHDAIEKLSLHAIKKHLNIKKKPDAVFVNVAKKAIPQYLIDHSQRVLTLEEKILALSPHLTLLGNGFYGVSINDCIQKASEVVKKFTTV